MMHYNIRPAQMGSRLKKLPISAMAALCVVILWGCLFIYTARAGGVSPLYFTMRQMAWLVCGSMAFLLAVVLPFGLWRKLAVPLYLFSILMLVLVLFFGKKIYGMTGWFELGKGVYFQPSEFAKIALLLILSTIRGGQESLRFLKMAACAVLTCFLVLLEPDLGTTLILITAFLAVYYVSGGRYLYLFFSLVLGALTAFFFALSKPYAWKRLTDFFLADQGSWHIRQFEFALGRGGFSGNTDAVWSNAYLPLPHTDSLYATIVESSGLIGGTLVLTLFVIFGILFMRMAQKDGLERDAGVYIFSIGFVYMVQALLHIGVNVVLLPTTGVTLPFLSYGGSSLVSILFGLGIAFSAVREVDPAQIR